MPKDVKKDIKDKKEKCDKCGGKKTKATATAKKTVQKGGGCGCAATPSY